MEIISIIFSLLIIVLIIVLIIILYFGCPINVYFININCLPVYISIVKALKLLSLSNTKENRQYVKSICCENNRFTEKFCKYANDTYYNIDINILSITIYEYILFVENVKEDKI